jgi:hypothetical protein
MEINYLIIIIFLLIIFNRNNIEKFTNSKRCKNGKKANGENCDCDEFNKRCPTKKEALDFIKKHGQKKLADLSPKDDKGCKQCYINLGNKGPHCHKRVIDCGENQKLDPNCLNQCNTKFENKENAKRCCIARKCKYPGNDYYSKKKKEEECTVNFVRSSSGETVASTSIKKSNKNIVDCDDKCAKEHPNNYPEKKCCIAECRFPGNNQSNVEFRRTNCEEANKIKEQNKQAQDNQAQKNQAQKKQAQKKQAQDNQAQKKQAQKKQTQKKQTQNKQAKNNSGVSKLPISIDDNLKNICAQLFE